MSYLVFNDEDPSLNKTLPFCVVCDEPIQDDDCYCLTEWENEAFDFCMCQKCKEEIFNDLKHKHFNTAFIEFVQSKIEETERRTPRQY